MNKYLSYFFFLILIGCTSKKFDNDLEKKQTFIKILGFIKTNQVDSIKKYYPYQEGDTGYFNNTVRNANMILNTSNSGISMDSIFINDSSFVLSTKKSFHNYYLRFYKDKKYTGAIGMNFYDNLNNSVSVIEYDVYVDEDKLINDLNKIDEKILKDAK